MGSFPKRIILAGGPGGEGGRAENGHTSAQVRGSAVPVPSWFDGFSSLRCRSRCRCQCHHEDRALGPAAALPLRPGTGRLPGGLSALRPSALPGQLRRPRKSPGGGTHGCCASCTPVLGGHLAPGFGALEGGLATGWCQISRGWCHLLSLSLLLGHPPRDTKIVLREDAEPRSAAGSDGDNAVVAQRGSQDPQHPQLPYPHGLWHHCPHLCQPQTPQITTSSSKKTPKSPRNPIRMGPALQMPSELQCFRGSGTPQTLYLLPFDAGWKEPLNDIFGFLFQSLILSFPLH